LCNFLLIFQAMCNKTFSICLDCFDMCFWISTFIVPLVTYIVIQKLRPRLEITSLIKEDKCIKVKVINKSRFFAANNLRIEICIFNEVLGFTYHFKPDHIDFLILPNKGWIFKKDNSKAFVCRKPSESAMILLKEESRNINLSEHVGFDMLLIKLNDEGYKLRVRCHAYHSFSGLGKSFEKIF
jgi:hypothetical protein